MYQIRLDDVIIHDYRDEELRVIEPKLSLELNKSSYLEFKILPNHPYFNHLKKLKSKIRVYKLYRGVYELLFEGRFPDLDSDFYNSYEVVCEGGLAYFLDSQQRPFEFHDISVEDFLRYVIDSHNSSVDEDKCFEVGRVTITGNLYRLSEKYVDTLEILNDRLLNRLGGYFNIRYEGNRRILDYLQEFEGISSQTIAFGENLLDLRKYAVASDVKTVIIPLGAKLEGGDKQLTIESVNNGKDYLENKNAIEIYGRIEGIIEFNDVTEAINLKKKGEEYLEEAIQESLSLELSAVDLGLLDASVDYLKIGDWCRVLSRPHGIDKVFLINRLDLDLESPENSTITLGQVLKGLSDEVVDTSALHTQVSVISENLNNTLTTVAGVVSDTQELTNVVTGVITNTEELVGVVNNVVLNLNALAILVNNVNNELINTHSKLERMTKRLNLGV